MNENADISRLELLERVALPMGNLSRTLEVLLNQDLEMNSHDLKQGLRNIQANAESIYQFLTCEDEKLTSVVGRRTPEVLRQFVAEKRRTGHLLSVVEN